MNTPLITYVFDQDSLAVSCALYNKNDPTLCLRMYSNYSGRTTHTVNESDCEMAKEIFSHYTHQLLWDQLRGKQLTSFKKDLSTYLYSDRTSVDEKFMGLVTKLPYFYEMDKNQAAIKEKCVSVIYRGPTKVSVNLKFLKLTKNHVKKNKANQRELEYWFLDQQNQAYLIRVGKGPLVHVWDNILTTNSEVHISGTVETKKYNDFSYYVFHAWAISAPKFSG